jgi:hypothetical protein
VLLVLRGCNAQVILLWLPAANEHPTPGAERLSWAIPSHIRSFAWVGETLVVVAGAAPLDMFACASSTALLVAML